MRGVNMSRIESRPTGTALGSYCFSIDCEGHVDDARVGEALMGLRRVCADVRFLGSYERHDGVAPDHPDGHVRPGVPRRRGLARAPARRSLTDCLDSAAMNDSIPSWLLGRAPAAAPGQPRRARRRPCWRCVVRRPTPAASPGGNPATVPADLEGLRGEVQALRGEAADALRHLAVVRYDAFGDMGGRLSWSLALLDDGGNGVVLTSIHGRSEARTYAKNVPPGCATRRRRPRRRRRSASPRSA